MLLIFSLLLGLSAAGTDAATTAEHQSIANTSNGEPVVIDIEGNVRSFIISDSMPLPYSEARFDLSAEGLNWKLKVEYLRLPGEGPKYREFAGDGIDIYEVVSWDPKIILERASQSGNTNTEIARVFEGSIPIHALPIDYAPWFAFVGAQYFKSQTNQYMLNILPHLETNDVLFEAGFAEAFPNMLAIVRMYKPGVRLRSAMRDVNGSVVKPSSIVYPPPFNQGFIGAEYSTTSWTNVNGYEFPSEFRLEYRDLKKDSTGGTYHLHPTDLIVGNVLNVRMTRGARLLLPNVSSDMTIIDQRLKGSGRTAVYNSKQASWIERGDPEFTNKIARFR